MTAPLFRRAFHKELAKAIPSWERQIDYGVDGLINVTPSGWKGQNFRIQDNRRDTITVYPLCEFGIQYKINAPTAELEKNPGPIFKAVIADIINFYHGKSIAHITHQKKSFFKKGGWTVQFIPLSELGNSKYATGSILSWNGKSDRNVPLGYHFLPQEKTDAEKTKQTASTVSAGAKRKS